jgi:alkaline phosphatase D
VTNRRRPELSSPTRFDRREFLGLVAAGFVAVSCSGGDEQGSGVMPASSLAVPVLDGEPFTLGVASGDPLPDSVILWTRLALDPLAAGGLGDMPDEPVPVDWEVAADDGFAEIVASGLAVAEPAAAHSVHVDASGLEPDSWYHYRFRVGEHTSVIGRTRTLPPIDSSPERLRFAFASCQNWQSGYFSAYPHMADEDLDLVMFLGDYIYEGGPSDDGVRVHDGPEVKELAAYRNRHALYRTDAGLQAAHAAFPWIATWDDHEVDNDYAADVGAPGAEPAEGDEFLARRAAGYRAWWEHLPLRVSPPDGADLDVYRDLRWGTLADVFVLDTRQYRSPQTCDDGGDLPVKPLCDEASAEGRTILGDRQRDWLTGGLATSDTSWNIIANQVVMQPLPIAGMFNMDQWDGYPADQAAVLTAIADAPSPTVVVTGDIHLSGVGEIRSDPADPSSDLVGMELVGTSISSSFGEELIPIVEQVAGEIPTVRYVNARQRGYVVVDVDASRVEAQYRLVETALEPSSPIATDVTVELPADRSALRTA